jgi:hypothetical protein
LQLHEAPLHLVAQHFQLLLLLLLLLLQGGGHASECSWRSSVLLLLGGQGGGHDATPVMYICSCSPGLHQV